MIDSSNKLLIFENFQVDRNLSKYRKNREAQEASEYMSSRNISVSVGEVMTVYNSPRTSSRRPRRFWTWVLSWFQRPDKGMSIQEFFRSAHNSMKELEIVEQRAEGYEAAMRQAQQAGQQALVEQLTGGLNAYRMETQLLALEMPWYMEEADLVRFYKQSKRGLKLDWIKNFTRQVPPDILTRKVRVDEVGIFDNYAILHYDPEAKAYAETAREVAARKDPILFGLMEGRRRLYVVGDWIDEYCDLTLDQIADAIGASAIKEIDPVDSSTPYRD
jgi:hypothetical protein